MSFCHHIIDNQGEFPYSSFVYYLKLSTLKCLIFVLFISFPSLILRADENIEDPYQISLMTIGPGKPLYIWWGHIGLIVDDKSQETSFFYDFGNFSFEADNFYRNFAMGRLYYLSIRTRTDPYLRYLSFMDRTVTIYELNLNGDEKKELVDMLEEGVRPENRTYLYHHYNNNCSTRIRDILDQVLDGHIRSKTDSYALSFRDQANRFIGPFWGYFILNYLQGSPVDAPITLWDALFLPSELEEVIDHLDRPEGGSLVSRKTILFQGTDPLIPSQPYPRLGEAFLRGMVLFIITLLIRLWGRRKTTGLWKIISVLLITLPSFLLFFMMTFTDHNVTHDNLNILVTFPLLILVLIPSKFIKNNRGEKFFQRCWDIQIILVLIALLAKTLPGLNQDNLGIILIYLPLYLAWGFAGSSIIRAIKLPQRSFKWSQRFLS